MPFPVLKFTFNRYGSPICLAAIVDMISLPAMVVPTCIYPKAYMEGDLNKRATLRFYNIPYNFLIRDKDQDIEEQSALSANNQVANKIVLVYESASEEGRRRLISKIKDYAFKDNATPKKHNDEDDFFDDTESCISESDVDDEDDEEDNDHDNDSYSEEENGEEDSISEGSLTSNSSFSEVREKKIMRRYLKNDDD
jgi:hypothetical protein